jgi:transposase InsO family protein
LTSLGPWTASRQSRDGSLHSRFKTENRSLLLDATSFAELDRIVGERIDYYNRRRRHSALGNQAPLVYLAGLKARR